MPIFPCVFSGDQVPPFNMAANEVLGEPGQ